ncbi:Kelch repeat-containing protein [Yeosuana sp.]|uniref:Kelch repeat-containing protein n=1 Tax=Yeosuana sp. TaxID=2529388 RepID=UPI00404AEDEA
MKKKRLTLILFIVLSATIFSNCSNDDNEEDLGNWIEGTVFDGIPRSSAISYTVGNYGYMGTGYDGDNYLSDFWEYDFEGGYWVQKADFIGEPRSLAMSFSIGENGYIGCGYDGTDERKDFYKYEKSTNSWSQIPDFGGGERRSGVAFASSNFGYVGCGYDGSNDRKDFWKYEPNTNSWTEIFGFGGGKRRDATTFTINNLVYLGTGKSNGIDLKDFWAFNLETESWTKLNDLDEEDDYRIKRSNGVGFSMGNYGYICSGTSSSTWEYDSLTDTWDEKTDFEGISRLDPITFYNGNRAFVLLGRSGTLYLDDMYEFFPFDEYDDED